jgi:hypothetical protein
MINELLQDFLNLWRLLDWWWIPIILSVSIILFTFRPPDENGIQ